MGYMVMTNWAILSILTAVVSENMLKVTEEHTEEAQKHDDERRETRSRTQLLELFNCVDKSSDGKLSKKEFRMLIEDSAYLLEFEQATNMEKVTLSKLFDYLADHPEEGAIDQVASISREEFIKGLQNENQD